MSAPEMWFQGQRMIPNRCQLCGAEVGLRSPGPEPDPNIFVIRCYACAALGEAEAITAEAAKETDA